MLKMPLKFGHLTTLIFYATLFSNIVIVEPWERKRPPVSNKFNRHQNVTQVSRLVKDLGLSDNNQFYNPDLIPHVDPTYHEQFFLERNSNLSETHLNVDIKMQLIEITNFDSINQVLSAKVWVRMSWSDIRLRWDPEQYGMVDSFRVNPSKIWVPDFTIYNTADSEKNGIIYELSNQVQVRVYSNGEIRWCPLVLWTFSCPMKLSYFPFDVQQCELQGGSWVHDYTRLRFIIGNSDNNETKNKMDTTHFIRNNVWYVKDTVGISKDTDYGETGHYQTIHYFFIMERNSSQFCITIISTCLIIIFLCAGTFIIPTEAGERLHLSLSIIIALSVYQLLASSMVPSGTDHYPMLSKFLLVLVAMLAFTVLITMINLFIGHSVQLSRPPTWLFEAVVIKFGKLLVVDVEHEWKRYKKSERQKAHTQYQEELNEGRAEVIWEKMEKRYHSLKAVRKPKKSTKVTSKEKNKIETSTSPRSYQSVHRLMTSSQNKQDNLAAATGQSATPTESTKAPAGGEHYSDTLADFEWDLINLSIDRWSLLIYISCFIFMIFWLLSQYLSTSYQYDVYWDEITRLAEKFYDCEIKLAVNKELSGSEDEYRQLFCKLKPAYEKQEYAAVGIKSD